MILICIECFICLQQITSILTDEKKLLTILLYSLGVASISIPVCAKSGPCRAVDIRGVGEWG